MDHHAVPQTIGLLQKLANAATREAVALVECRQEPDSVATTTSASSAHAGRLRAC